MSQFLTNGNPFHTTCNMSLMWEHALMLLRNCHADTFRDMLHQSDSIWLGDHYEI